MQHAFQTNQTIKIYEDFFVLKMRGTFAKTNPFLASKYTHTSDSILAATQTVAIQHKRDQINIKRANTCVRETESPATQIVAIQHKRDQINIKRAVTCVRVTESPATQGAYTLGQSGRNKGRKLQSDREENPLH